MRKKGAGHFATINSGKTTSRCDQLLVNQEGNVITWEALLFMALYKTPVNAFAVCHVPLIAISQSHSSFIGDEDVVKEVFLSMDQDYFCNKWVRACGA